MVEMSQLFLDLQELEKLESITKRTRLQKLLLNEKAKLQNEIKEMENSKSQAEAKMSTPVQPKIATVKITSYAWDQSEKFVKIYLSNLSGVQNLQNSDVSLVSDDQMHTLTVHNLNGKNYLFNVPKLLHRVDNVTFKIKSDMILLMLRKEKPCTWKYLTEQERITKDQKEKMPAVEKEGDPSASIMNMMKKMYDEGDDEMKRTIAKAWTESRDKVDK